MPQNGQVAKQGKQDSTMTRLASIGQISAGIAHEVRNPLTSVKGFLQLLQRESSHKYVDIALSELDRAIDTLQNLLHVSKPDLDDESACWISLYSEMQSILYLFQDKIYVTEIVEDYKNTDVKIFGKRNQLKKALFNLLKNAFEAMPKKGKIEIRHYKQNNCLFLVIRDNGVGIPEDKLNLLGTPFFTTKTEGTGMGLAQVYTTVYQHGATIHVQSKVNAGTTFTLQFPIMKKGIYEVKNLQLNTKDFQGNLLELISQNKKEFLERVEKEAPHVFDKVKDLHAINIVQTMEKLIEVLNDENQPTDLVILGKEHGMLWAKHSVSLLMKIEFIHAFRKIYWEFLYQFYQSQHVDQTQFFQLERRINATLDIFLEHFTASYQQYQSDVMLSQREMIDDLTSPIIPLSEEMAILPIVGTLDTHRAKTIQERALTQVSNMKIKRIVIDLSSVAYMDTAVVGHLFRIVHGISLLGCNAVITGLRPEIVNTMIELGIQMPDRVATYGTLQQALEDIL